MSFVSPTSCQPYEGIMTPSRTFGTYKITLNFQMNSEHRLSHFVFTNLERSSVLSPAAPPEFPTSERGVHGPMSHRVLGCGYRLS